MNDVMIRLFSDLWLIVGGLCGGLLGAARATLALFWRAFLAAPACSRPVAAPLLLQRVKGWWGGRAPEGGSATIGCREVWGARWEGRGDGEE